MRESVLAAPPAAPAAADIPALTALRGIAALAVVLHHYAGAFLPAIDPGRFTGLVQKSFLFVDFFFVLSGYVLSHAYGARFRSGLGRGDLLRFGRARFARLYPLHLAVLLGFLALEGVKVLCLADFPEMRTAPPFTGARDPFAFVVNLLMLQTTGLLDRLTWNGPAWSIGAEWPAYLAFPLLMLLVARCGRGRLALLAALSLLGLALLAAHAGTLDVTFDLGIPRCLFGFTLGMVAHALFAGARRPLPRADLAAGLVGLAILAALHLRAPAVLLPALFALAVPLAAAARGRVGRALSGAPLVFLGTISYALYLVHYLVLDAVQLGSLYLTDAPFGSHFGPGASLAILALLLGALVPLSAVLHARIEEPWRRALR